MKNSFLIAAMLAVALSACGKKEEASAPAVPAAAAAPAPAETPKANEATSAATPEKK